MKSYLSIDVDFWTNPVIARPQLNKLIQTAMKRLIPITSVMNHQQMLGQVDSSGANKLINIDLHSDLVSTDINKLHCGSWVSYVKWRKKGVYLWLHSGDIEDGDCNGMASSWNSNVDWNVSKQSKRHQSLDLLQYLKNCVGLGLCMSPAYADKDIQNIFRDIVKKFQIPYKKGQRSEHIERFKRPPNIREVSKC